MNELVGEEALRLETGVLDWRVVGREYRKILFGIG